MPITNQKPQNRRYFIKTAGIGLLALAALLWDKLVKTEKYLSVQKTVSIPFNPNKDISFYNDFIVVNRDGKPKVFSSHCTHLGCLINRSHNGQLLCPCHGSTFDMTGKPLKGPATRPLEEKAFAINDAMNQITIEV